MASGTVKLFKIASEINIGKDAIVEFLQLKGYDIQNKATATLDEKMVDLVMEKFKKEKRAAEIQRDKIQKHKDIKTEVKKVDDKIPHIDKPSHSTITSKKEHEHHTDTPEAHHEIVIDEHIELESPTVIIEQQPVQTENDIVAVETHSSEDIISVVDVPKPEINDSPISQIELPQEVEQILDNKHELDKITEHKPHDIKVDIPHEVKAKESKIEVHIEETKPEVKMEVVADEKTHIPYVEQITTETHSEIQVVETLLDTPAESQPEDTNADDLSEQGVSDDDASGTDTETSQEGKRRDKKKKKRKFDETEPGESPQLKGLTVLGKIDLRPAAPEKPVRPEKKNKHDHKEHDKATKFKKRKHIKGGSDTPAEQTSGSTTTTPKSIPGLIKEKDRIKLAEAQNQSVDKTSKFKDKDAPPATAKAKEVEKEDRKKRKRKKTIREMISQEEVDRAIKETLSGMDGTGFTSQRAKLRMKKRIEREEKEQKIQEEKERDSKVLKISEFVTTGDLANMMNINTSEIILKCMELGLMVTINQRLDKDTITLISDDYGFEVEFLDEKEIQLIDDDIDEEETLEHRPPIVTIMGHVDHGKTSLLDFIRNANVVAGEAGGITQHIGAYSVQMTDGKSITFLDTPGHEAFTAMRARGAQVTDIVILVVAADDSVMPQTIEAISHAKAANVPIIVAINKIDKADANPDRIRQQLADHAVLVEEWGGKYQSVEISAKKGLNIDKLLEKVIIEAEILDLKANHNRNSRGIVIESNMKKGWGSTATIIVQKGTLKVGDPFVSGIHSGRVRALLNERENKIEETGPSTPVIVIGYDGLPEVGDTFIVTNTESEAREIANERKQLKREQDMRKVRHMTLDQISAQIQIGGVRELNLVLKGDVAGSVEALSDSLQKLSRDEVRVAILHKGVGPITETDVMLAAASNAVVIGFNVNPTGKARKAAENELVDIRIYDIIYDCLNEIQLALEGLLAPEYKEEVVATVEVRKTFKVSRIGTIAGCFVKSGKISRNDKVRVLRDGFSEFEGTIASLKRGKDDVKDVDTGFECGIQLNGYNDIIEGDIVEAFKVIEIKRKFK